MAAKHYLIYYKLGSGTFIVTEPRPWAKENQHLFPEYDFINRFPITTEIENRLINQYGFQKVIENDDIVLIQNFNTNLNL
jgi:hypothetical protein